MVLELCASAYLGLENKKMLASSYLAASSYIVGGLTFSESCGDGSCRGPDCLLPTAQDPCCGVHVHVLSIALPLWNESHSIVNSSEMGLYLICLHRICDWRPSRGITGDCPPEDCVAVCFGDENLPLLSEGRLLTSRGGCVGFDPFCLGSQSTWGLAAHTVWSNILHFTLLFEFLCISSFLLSYSSEPAWTNAFATTMQWSKIGI